MMSVEKSSGMESPLTEGIVKSPAGNRKGLP